jgi:phosphatidylglycerophosphate synthase
VLGLLIAAAAAAAFWLTGFDTGVERLLWLSGVGFLVGRILANTLDGMVAVEGRRPSRVGLLYNEAPDRIGDAMVLIGCGYAEGGSAELGYLAACIALFVAYARTLAQFAGAPGDFSGPMAKGHRVMVIACAATYMAGAPHAWRVRWGPDEEWGIMGLALLLITIGGALTAARRLRSAGRFLRAQD